MLEGKFITASVLVLLVLIGIRAKTVTSGQSDAPSARGVAVYVADFELSAAADKAPDSTNPTQEDDLRNDPQHRSRHIQDCFAETLIETLGKQGYSSFRKQDLPRKGILLQGVFAELDQKNRIRRALLGSGSPGTTL